MNYIIIPGFKTGSNLVWAFEEQHLYYKNACSKAKLLESCKCYRQGCKARLYIREDGTAFRFIEINNAKNHGSMYSDFKQMYCFNKMKKEAETAPPSTTPFQIYQKVVLE